MYRKLYSATIVGNRHPDNGKQLQMIGGPEDDAVIKTELEDVIDVVQMWENALMGYVVKGNP